VVLLLHQRAHHLPEDHEAPVDADGLDEPPARGLGFFHALRPGQVDEVQLRPHGVVPAGLLDLQHEGRVGARRALVHGRGRVPLPRFPDAKQLEHGAQAVGRSGRRAREQAGAVAAGEPHHDRVAGEQVGDLLVVDLHVPAGRCEFV
jgi:hypothetical protein